MHYANHSGWYDGVHVAVKKLKHNDHQTKHLFIREAKLTLLCSHPNIVKAFCACLGEAPKLLLGIPIEM
jgi:hypothetical protein